MKKFVKNSCSLILLINLFGSVYSSAMISNYNHFNFNNNIGLQNKNIFPKVNHSLDKRKSILPIVGSKDLLNFLSISVYPMGLVLYTWGGGWNAQDDGSGSSATTIGLKNRLLDFARSHFNDNKDNKEADEKDEIEDDYVKTPPVDELGNKINLKDNKKSMYKYIYDGFDCSGFVGWAVYNFLNIESGNEGYVCSSTKFSNSLSEKGFGTCFDVDSESRKNGSFKFCPGDIISIKGHVYISLGQCRDNSILLVHSTNPGVCIMGTTNPNDEKIESDSIKIAKKCNELYPLWNKWYNYHRKDKFSRSFSKYASSAQVFRWDVNKNSLEDKQNIQNMSAEQVIKYIFPNIKL